MSSGVEKFRRFIAFKKPVLFIVDSSPNSFPFP